MKKLFGAAGLCLLATAWLLGHEDPRTPFAAIGTATLLLTDAWFDVVTAGGARPCLS